MFPILSLNTQCKISITPFELLINPFVEPLFKKLQSENLK